MLTNDRKHVRFCNYSLKCWEKRSSSATQLNEEFVSQCQIQTGTENIITEPQLSGKVIFKVLFFSKLETEIKIVKVHSNDLSVYLFFPLAVCIREKSEP